MAPLVTWDEEEAKTHLEVRSEGDWRTIHIEGDIARSQKDWVYWRLPTAITKQAVTPEEGAVELAVRLERGEARVGLIAEGVKPGENWNEEKMRDAAYFLDPFFGVLRSGDIDLAAGSSLKAVQGDTVTISLRSAEALFLVNGKEVGAVPLGQARPLKLAAQMWDRGDAVRIAEQNYGGQAILSPSMSPIKGVQTPRQEARGPPQESTPNAGGGVVDSETTPGGGDSQLTAPRPEVTESAGDDGAAAPGGSEETPKEAAQGREGGSDEPAQGSEEAEREGDSEAGDGAGGVGDGETEEGGEASKGDVEGARAGAGTADGVTQPEAASEDATEVVASQDAAEPAAEAPAEESAEHATAAADSEAGGGEGAPAAEGVPGGDGAAEE